MNRVCFMIIQEDKGCRVIDSVHERKETDHILKTTEVVESIYVDLESIAEYEILLQAMENAAFSYTNRCQATARLAIIGGLTRVLNERRG